MAFMNSPRSGFRRTAVASWALAGIGAAGVAGASALAYAGTVKPAPEPVSVAGEPTTDPAGPADGIPTVVGAAAAPVATQPPAPPPPPVPAQASAQTVQTDTPQPARTGQPQYQADPAGPTTPIAPIAPIAPAAVAPAPVAVTAPVPVSRPAGVAGNAVPGNNGGQSSFPVRKTHVQAGGSGSSGGNKYTPSHTASKGS